MKTIGFTLVPLVLAVLGCGSSDDLASARGELGRGTFVYECFGDTDSACLTETTSFPQAVAVGSRFSMSFEVSKGATPNVISAAPSSIAPRSGGFDVLRAGQTALLAVNGNTEVIDMLHVRSAAIDQIKVRPNGSDALAVSRIELEQGESLRLVAIPNDAAEVELGGALDYEWESADEDVLSVQTLSELNRIEVSGIAGGETTLDVKIATQSFEVEVTVTGGSTPPDPVDAGTDAAQSADAGDGGAP